VREIRTAGSGILKNPDQWVQQLAGYVRDLEQQNGGKPVRVVLTAHKTCGAGAQKYGGKPNSDELAHRDIEGLAEKLIAQGINAVCEREYAPMNGLKAHNALGVTVDGTHGRMQCPPFNSFALSSPDEAGFAGEAALATTISTKPLDQDGHGYGDLLRETKAPYTILAYTDPARPRQSHSILHELDRALAQHRANGVRIRVIERPAPKDETHVPVTEVRVVCMDERCNVE
jgi:hypothetical protein